MTIRIQEKKKKTKTKCVYVCNRMTTFSRRKKEDENDRETHQHARGSREISEMLEGQQRAGEEKQ